jgi:hypothetical protein
MTQPQGQKGARGPAGRDVDAGDLKALEAVADDYLGGARRRGR